MGEDAAGIFTHPLYPTSHVVAKSHREMISAFGNEQCIEKIEHNLMVVWEEKMEAQRLNRMLTKAQILTFLKLDHKLKESKEQVMERLMKLIDEDTTA